MDRQQLLSVVGGAAFVVAGAAIVAGVVLDSVAIGPVDVETVGWVAFLVGAAVIGATTWLDGERDRAALWLAYAVGAVLIVAAPGPRWVLLVGVAVVVAATGGIVYRAMRAA